MKKQKSQQEEIRAARAALNVTTEELAGMLGRTLPTIRAWLLPRTSKAHRPMPEAARNLLRQLVSERRAKK